jgi:4-amino-4-deoxy-L-arabinose transferase-like glycosyltransferase
MSARLSTLLRSRLLHLLALGLLALLVRVVAGVVFRFDGLYGQDPYAYYNYAQQLARALAAGEQPPAFFWPLGYPLLVAVASTVTGWRPLAGQSVSILAGASLAPLVYLLVLAIRPRAAAGALAAGLVAATAAQLTLSSLSVMADTAGLAWATLSAWAMLRYLRRLTPGWLALAALTLGLAVITRWVSGLLVIPWAAAAFLTWRADGRSWPWRLGQMGLAVLAGGLAVGLQLLLSLVQPGAYTGDLQVVSWNPANAWLRSVTNPDGTFHYHWPAALFYAQPIFHPRYIFPLLVPFWLAGLAFFWRYRQRHVGQAALIVGWAVVVYIFLAGLSWQSWRFPLTFFPSLVVLTGLGFQAAWQKASGLRARQSLRQLILLGWLAVSLVGTLAWNLRDVRNFANWSNDLIAAAHWTEAQLPPDAMVITFSLTLTLENRTGLDVEEIYHLDEAELAQLVEERPALYLLLDLDNVASQWVGLSPADNLAWLRQNTRLVELDTWPPFTLFRIDLPDRST